MGTHGADRHRRPRLARPDRRGARPVAVRRRAVGGTGKARTLRVTVDKDGGVDLDAITAVTHAVSPSLDAEPALGGFVPPRGQQPGRRAPAAHARALRRRTRRDRLRQVPHTEARPATRARRARRLRRRRAASSRATTARRRDRIRRHHPGAHRLRMGPAAARLEEAGASRHGQRQRAKKGARA